MHTIRLSLVVLIFLISPARGEEPTLFPFVLPWDDASPSITNIAALNPTPAGGAGFIRPGDDGHFRDDKGRRVRFLGVNFTFGANFTDKESAQKVAARMHKFGINVVRLHHMDYFRAPAGIFDRRFKDTQHLDREQLDRLDYLIHQFKQHGIYTNINLHVSRDFNAADGLPQTERLPERGKIANYFMPRMIELQKKYARDLLTHRNPYTQTCYIEEPAVAFIELTNENTLLGAAWNGTLDNLPRPYQDELRKQWNAWLKERYGDMDALRRAWKATAAERGSNLLRAMGAAGVAPWVMENHQGARGVAERIGAGGPPGVAGSVLRLRVSKSGESWHVQIRQAGLDMRDGETYTLSFWARADRKRRLDVSASLDVDDWHNIGLASRQNLDTKWWKIQLVFTAVRTRKNHGRLVFAAGAAEGTVELAGLSLQRGAEALLPKDASLQASSVPLSRPSDSPAGRDWIAFLIHTERRFLETMRTYIKDELHTRANVACSQASYGGIGGALRELHADYVDMHNYWEHPHFPRRPWDPVDWRIGNTPMTRERYGGTLKGLARYRLAGKPFTVSEYNHPAPSDYQAECVPMLAAFAAFQDWDGFYLFDYHDAAGDWNCDRIRGFFAVGSNPAKMALLPAAAMLFLRGDLAPAAEETRLNIPERSVVEMLARQGPDIGSAWNAIGGVWPEALRRRVSVAFVPATDRRKSVGAASRAAQRVRLGKPDLPPSIRPLDWRGVGTEQAIFTADSPRSKLAVGLLGGQTVELSDWRVKHKRSAPTFAAVTLTAMDDRPVSRSRSLLLTAVGRVENKGMQWNAARNSVGNHWGSAPTLAEGVPATISIRTSARTATVHALDATGKRRARVEARLDNGSLTFAIGPECKTVWYEIAADFP